MKIEKKNKTFFSWICPHFELKSGYHHGRLIWFVTLRLDKISSAFDVVSNLFLFIYFCMCMCLYYVSWYDYAAYILDYLKHLIGQGMLKIWNNPKFWKKILLVVNKLHVLQIRIYFIR